VKPAGSTLWGAGVLALAFGVVPASAQERPVWSGLWEGEVGRAQVRACFDGREDSSGQGSYYYLRYLEPIALRQSVTEHEWVEWVPGADTKAEWHFSELSGTRLRGTWRQGARSLPFALRPSTWDASGDGSPCESAAFLRPRLAGGRVVTEPGSSGPLAPGAFPLTRHVYWPPPHLAEDVSLETFTIAEQQPGDRRINQVLRAAMPDAGGSVQLAECLGMSIASLGIDGAIELTIEPLMLTGAFLSAEEVTSSFCGGAHPSHWSAYLSFDRMTGEELDLFDWIGEARLDGEDAALPEALRTAIIARWTSAEELPECRELFEGAEYWTLGLDYGGLLFRPDFPHVATACEETVLLEWEALTPFLDDEGRAGLARLRQR
jgi:hypothetical protein